MMRYISKRAGVACITEMIREPRLWWFGHVMRKKDEAPMKKAWNEPIRWIKKMTEIKLDGGHGERFEECGIERRCGMVKVDPRGQPPLLRLWCREEACQSFLQTVVYLWTQK